MSRLIEHAWRCSFLFACILTPALGCGGRADPEKPDLKKPDVKNIVATGPVWFEDVTAKAGINHTYRNGEEADQYSMLEAPGGGVALFDYDGDGRLDIFFAGGGQFNGPEKKTIAGLPCRLFKNIGGGRFEDVSSASGIGEISFYSHGCAVADFDRDGWPDLLVTGWGKVALLHNEAAPAGGRRFVDTFPKSGLKAGLWTTGAAWGDIDGDGFPDLYLCQYVNWSFENHPFCRPSQTGKPRDVCPPTSFAGLVHPLYRNNGDGTFTDVTEKAGLAHSGLKDDAGRPVDLGKGLGVLIADVDDDGKPDLYVANDTTNNFLYRNVGGGKFTEIGWRAGVARDDKGQANGSMGIDVGDYDRSGRASLIVTNYENETHALYQNLGGATFNFATQLSGLSAIGSRYVGFGVVFADFDRDGWEELAISNGHVVRFPIGATVRQRPVLLRNQGKGRFRDIASEGGEYFRKEHLGRGVAVGDLDDDGRLDLVVSHVNEPATLLKNVHPAAGTHWVGIVPRGKKNRSVVGATVTLQAGGERFVRFVKSGGSYLSHSDDRLQIGLAAIAQAETLTIRWPYGDVQTWDVRTFPVDRFWYVGEGSSEIQLTRSAP